MGEMSSRKRAAQIRRQVLRNLNALFGAKMTSEHLKTMEELRAKVKSGEITVKQAHEIWAEKYGER
jgi:hypothetical protein